VSPGTPLVDPSGQVVYSVAYGAVVEGQWIPGHVPE
jgi:hypothetical protein